MRKFMAMIFLGTAVLFISIAAYSQKIETVDGVPIVHNKKGDMWGRSPDCGIEVDQPSLARTEEK